MKITQVTEDGITVEMVSDDIEALIAICGEAATGGTYEITHQAELWRELFHLADVATRLGWHKALEINRRSDDEPPPIPRAFTDD